MHELRKKEGALHAQRLNLAVYTCLELNGEYFVKQFSFYFNDLVRN
jgi:hypothetical protein